MPDSPYFIPSYFDPSYFDAAITTSTGHGARKRPSRMQILSAPEPEPLVDEDWISLIL